jgi:hypothetical protein
MMCEACERGDHELCGMQTWCECDCPGADDVYLPDDYGEPWAREPGYMGDINGPGCDPDTQ